MTERTLVQAAQSGRPEATDELVERYYPRVYSFVATLKGADAEDLTQEVFARALGALPRFNGEYQFGAWLLQIARNVCIDEARRQTKRPQPTDPIDLVELETAAQPDHVWESISAQIAVTTVHKALNRLPKRQRSVLILRELEGMSYSEMAIALRISTRAVEISLSRARKRMRVELASLDLAEEEMAECRRMASLLATNPGAMSREDVAGHLRTCRLCQAIERKHRPRQIAHGAVALVMAGSTHLGELLRRNCALGQRLVQTFVSSPGTATLSPLSRLAEVGATVAVATAVSAGMLGAPAVQQTLPAAVPVAVPIVDHQPDAALTAQVSAGDPPVATAVGPATSATSATLPVVGAVPCILAGAGHVLSPAPNTASTASSTPAQGTLLSELLSPATALSPVLDCDPTLSQVGAAVRSLSGAKPAGGGSQATTESTAPQSASPMAPALNLVQYLLRLLGLTH